MGPRLSCPRRCRPDLLASPPPPISIPSFYPLRSLPLPPFPPSLHPYISTFSYGSKRVITEIQTRPTKDHRGIKPAVQFSAGVLMLSTRCRETLNFTRVFHCAGSYTRNWYLIQFKLIFCNPMGFQNSCENLG